MRSGAISSSAMSRLGLISTDLSIDGTWVDGKGHTRMMKMRADGNYKNVCERHQKAIRLANENHQKWKKKFMRKNKLKGAF